jgi:hypothetical protein
MMANMVANTMAKTIHHGPTRRFGDSASTTRMDSIAAVVAGVVGLEIA